MLTIPNFTLTSTTPRPIPGRRTSNVASDAFRAKFYCRTRAHPDGCVTWAGSHFRDGYGQCVFEGRNQRTHRIAWILERGAIPRDLQVLHRCDVPSCVNVNHLFLGTTQENTADKIAKGRARYTRPTNPARGTRSGTARLTDDLVRAMRHDRDGGYLLKDLVVKYGYPLATVYRAVSRKTWTHVQ